jgi:Fic family protein
VASRLEILEQWLQVESSRELGPAQAGALVLARLVEILPFDDGNGRVSRLAASHLMVRAGARAPILVADDEPRLREALQAAFQLQTEPLARLLDEAAERSLDVMIEALERGVR